MKKSLILKAIAGAVICLAVGGLSGLITADAIPNWYAQLDKPAFNPPNWIFGPVWTILYILMGVSAGIILDQGWQKDSVREAIQVFGVHLLLNAFWTILFFGFKQPGAAFVEILILLTTILVYTRKFFRIKKFTVWMQIPYIMWVIFATILNLSIVLLN